MKNKWFWYNCLIFLPLAVVWFACNDDEPAGPEVFVSISTPRLIVNESDGEVVFTVSLSQPNETGNNVNVLYAVSGSANPDEDFEPLKGLIAIPNGASSAEIVMILIDDEEVEADKIFLISLSGGNLPSNYGLGDVTTLQLEIEDND